MNTLKLSERLDQAFPQPKGNRGSKPSQFIQTLILMQHEGSFHLNDVRDLEDESPLMAVLGIKTIPKAGTLGAWLKRMGEESPVQSLWELVNKVIQRKAIKGLKLDFGGDTLPCSHFKANNLYFLISALSYNLFALMRQLLPVELSHHRVTTIR